MQRPAEVPVRGVQQSHARTLAEGTDITPGYAPTLAAAPIHLLPSSSSAYLAGLDILRRLEGWGFQPRPAVALSVRGSQARHPGSLPAQPRHALPRFRARW